MHIPVLSFKSEILSFLFSTTQLEILLNSHTYSEIFAFEFNIYKSEMHGKVTQRPG